MAPNTKDPILEVNVKLQNEPHPTQQQLRNYEARARLLWDSALTVFGNLYAQWKDKTGMALIRYIRSNPIRFEVLPHGNSLRIKVFGPRELLKALGIPGNLYRYGSKNADKVLKSLLEKTPQTYFKNASGVILPGVREAMSRALQQVPKNIQLPSWRSTYFAVGLDCILKLGTNEELVLGELAKSVADNFINSEIASAIGSAAAIVIGALCGLAASVITVLALVIGTIVGIVLVCLDVKPATSAVNVLQKQADKATRTLGEFLFYLELEISRWMRSAQISPGLGARY